MIFELTKITLPHSVLRHFLSKTDICYCDKDRHDHEDPGTIDIGESVKACAEEARAFKEAGFRAVKMKVGLLTVAEDLRRIEAVREAIGPDLKLMVDANHAYSVGKMMMIQFHL